MSRQRQGKVFFQINPVFNFYHIFYFSAFSQQYLMVFIMLLPKTNGKKKKSQELDNKLKMCSRCVQVDRKYDRAMLTVTARNLKLAARGSQQL